MKWFTKRVQLISNDKMYLALSKVLVDFVDKLKSDEKIIIWYTSLKNDDGHPSFRVYLQIEDHDEEFVKSEFNHFLEANNTDLGWTGQFIEPDPEQGTPPSYPHLNEINMACELVLKITKAFPESNRNKNINFWINIRTELIKGLHSIAPEHHKEFIHFIANNLALSDKKLIEILNSIIRFALPSTSNPSNNNQSPLKNGENNTPQNINPEKTKDQPQ